MRKDVTQTPEEQIQSPAETILYGKIIKSTGGLYSVESEGSRAVYECRAKGTFRRDRITPLTGDRVSFQAANDGTGFIVEILPRKNSLIRPAVANVDLLLLVIAAAHPDPDLFILDKLTAIAAFNGIEPLLIINKCDLADASRLERIYTTAGIRTVCVTANKPDRCADSLAEIRAAASGKVCFFSGASGVGKSSLLNALYPGFALATGEISRKIARGKHTTRVTELFRIGDNTYIGDTPGFSMVDVVGFQLLTGEGLLGSFPDIERYAVGCRYTDCTHVCEDGCQVMAAIADGKIGATRHESFVKLYRELKSVNKWDLR